MLEIIDLRLLNKKQRAYSVPVEIRKSVRDKLYQESEEEKELKESKEILTEFTERLVHKYLIPESLDKLYEKCPRLNIERGKYFTMNYLEILNKKKEDFIPKNINPENRLLVSGVVQFNFKRPLPYYIGNTHLYIHKYDNSVYISDFYWKATPIEKEMYDNALENYIIASEKAINFLCEYRTIRYNRYVEFGKLKTLQDFIDVNPEWAILVINELGEDFINSFADKKTKIGIEMQTLDQLIELGNK